MDVTSQSLYHWLGSQLVGGVGGRASNIKINCAPGVLYNNNIIL